MEIYWILRAMRNSEIQVMSEYFYFGAVCTVLAIGSWVQKKGWLR